MVNALKQELINDMSLLMKVLMDFLKENQERLLTLYRDLKEFIMTSLIIHDSFMKARRKMRRVLNTSRNRLMSILHLFFCSKVAENKSFTKLMETQFERMSTQIGLQKVTVKEQTHYLAEASDFVSRIRYFAQYTQLKQMISLEKSILSSTYQASDALVCDLTTLFMLMSLHKIETLDASRALFLINYVYTKHSDEIERYTGWFLETKK